MTFEECHEERFLQIVSNLQRMKPIFCAFKNFDAETPWEYDRTFTA